MLDSHNTAYPIQYIGFIRIDNDQMEVDLFLKSAIYLIQLDHKYIITKLHQNYWTFGKFALSLEFDFHR